MKTLSKSPKRNRNRLLFLLITFTVLFIAILVRFLWIQIVDGAWYKNMAYAQENKGQVISPKRGVIYDRNGKELAINLPVKTISCDPHLVQGSKLDIDQIAQKISEILQIDKGDLLKKLQKSNGYQLIKKKADTEVSDTLKKWANANKVDGIYIDEDSKRFYPNKNLAAHVIGFAGSDNQGLSGIELTMEQYLKGKPGKHLSEVDAYGLKIPFSEEKKIDVQDGLNVVLTIDEAIQFSTEKALQKAIYDYKVINGGTAIVLDPRNGDILAMVSKPDFDLDDPYAFPIGVTGFDSSSWSSLKSNEKVKKLQETVWRNKAINITYEPGSTFKSIISATSLEEGIIAPNSEVFDVPIKVADWTINSDMPGGHGKESFSQSFYNSDNPVFVKLAQALGIEKFYNYVKSFGFFDTTGIDLPGEAKSIFQKKPAEIDMATASFGQNFQITPIQLITAYAAIANGGNLLRPHLIKNLTDSNGNIVTNYEPEVVRNVLSKQSCDTLKGMLEGVVMQGTGTNAYVSGYRVAGKTGTAETFENGVRSKDRFIASFSAFAPADNPVINVLVVLDYPSEKSHFGGATAAPAAARIIEDTLEYLGVDRKYTDRDIGMMTKEINLTDITKRSVEDAEGTLSGLGLRFKIIGSGYNNSSIIVNQEPKPGESIPEKSVVILYINKGDKETIVKVPDVSNKTIPEATQALNDVGLNIKVKGTGTVVSQEYKAGFEVPIGKVIEIDFINEAKSD